MRISFLLHLEAHSSERRKIKSLQTEQALEKKLALRKHELELVENKKVMVESEKKSLRALIGNVAHDLKVRARSRFSMLLPLTRSHLV